MKKLFTLIALTCGIIPALHGMDTNLPADVLKKYNNLTVLIQNADIEAFKPAFDALTLPTENIAALRQTIAETKAAITNELESMGDKIKSWSKIFKGGLASIGGTIAGASSTALLTFLLNKYSIENERIENLSLPFAIPTLLPMMLFTSYLKKLKHTTSDKAIYITALLYLGTAYKAIPYGIRTFKIGLNYKEHLQNMLVDLDAIDAHIAQPKA